MKKVIITAWILVLLFSVSFSFSSCVVVKHDPNVKFETKGHDYIKVRKMGCPENVHFIGY